MKYVWTLNCEEGWRSMVFLTKKGALDYIEEMYPKFKNSYEESHLIYFSNGDEIDLRLNKTPVICSKTVPEYVWVLLHFANEETFVFKSKDKAFKYIDELFPTFKLKHDGGNYLSYENKDKKDVSMLRLEKELVFGIG